MELTIITIILGGTIIFQIMTAGLRWWFQAYQKLEYEALLISVLSPAKLGLGLLVFALGGGLIPLAGIVVGANFLVLSVAYSITKKHFHHTAWEIDLKFWKKFMTKNVPFTLAIIFAAIFGNIDKILLSLMKGDAVTGWYSAASQALIPMRVIPSIFSMAMLPVFAEYYVVHKTDFDRLIQKSLRYMLIIVFPLAISVTLLAEKIMLLLFGAEFVNGAAALSILAWAAAATFINMTVGKAIIAAEGTITLLVLTWAYRRAALNIQVFRTLLRPLSAALIMGACIYLVRDYSLWLLIPLGAGIYSGCLHTLKVFPEDEKALIKRMLLGMPAGGR